MLTDFPFANGGVNQSHKTIVRKLNISLFSDMAATPCSAYTQNYMLFLKYLRVATATSRQRDIKLMVFDP